MTPEERRKVAGALDRLMAARGVDDVGIEEWAAEASDTELVERVLSAIDYAIPGTRSNLWLAIDRHMERRLSEDNERLRGGKPRGYGKTVDDVAAAIVAVRERGEHPTQAKVAEALGVSDEWVKKLAAGKWKTLIEQVENR